MTSFLVVTPQGQRMFWIFEQLLPPMRLFCQQEISTFWLNQRWKSLVCKQQHDKRTKQYARSNIGHGSFLGLQFLWSHLVTFLKWSQKFPDYKLEIDAITLPLLENVRILQTTTPKMPKKWRTANKMLTMHLPSNSYEDNTARTKLTLNKITNITLVHM